MRVELNAEKMRACMMRSAASDVTMIGVDGYRVNLPVPVAKKIQELIRQDDVRSVSCCYDDRDVWEALVQEQVKRATASGLLSQDAYFLSGPDVGLWDTPVEEWGGYCHIP